VCLGIGVLALVLLVGLWYQRDEGSAVAGVNIIDVRNGSPTVSCNDGPLKLLVLRDEGATDGERDGAQLIAVQTANLVSRFGRSDIVGLDDYTNGQMAAYDGVVYVAAVSKVSFPQPLLAELAAFAGPVVWAGPHFDQLEAAAPSVVDRFGWRSKRVRAAVGTTVSVGKITFASPPLRATALVEIDVVNPGRASVFATVRTGNDVLPWAVEADGWTFVAENPYFTLGEGDRDIAWSELLVRAFAPQTPVVRRALVRIEDVGPATDPDRIRAMTRLLSGRGVPFSIAAFPFYRDIAASADNGEVVSRDLSEAPELVAALKEAVAAGATLVMHGVTHQYSERPNPYNGRSGADYEFVLAHLDAAGAVIIDGPVPEESTASVARRVDEGLREFRRVGLPRPDVFDTPHYAASATATSVFAKMFSARYERPRYYAGSRWNHQTPLYLVKDSYGGCVIPETLGFVAPDRWFALEARLPAEILANAERLMVLRDGVASFFVHDYISTEYLEEMVDGLEARGFEFVAPTALSR
jgi:uncharacterized protein YdaL